MSSTNIPAPAVDVLVVDDERHVRDVMTRMLTLLGYRPRQAYDVATAREEIRHQFPQMVFLDINMPGPSGLELLQELAPMWPTVAVVMSTAVGDIDTAMEAIRIGAADYVQKPVNLQTLKLVASRTIERRTLLIENRNYQQHLEALVESRTRELQQKTMQLLRTQAALVHGLCRLTEFRDPETGEHLDRMANYAFILAQRMVEIRPELPKNFAALVHQAAPLHDIGKVGVPDSILLKPAELSDYEFETIKRHTIIGAETLKLVQHKLENEYAPFLDVGMEICLGHHERWDGTGYPYGKHGEEIPMSARIAAIADYFDACTSSRVYRPQPIGHPDVFEDIATRAGTAFDPIVANAFLSEKPQIIATLQMRDTPLDRVYI